MTKHPSTSTNRTPSALLRAAGVLLVATVAACNTAEPDTVSSRPPVASTESTVAASTASPSTATPSPVTPSTFTQSTAVAALAGDWNAFSNYISDLAATDMFSGAALVARDGEPLVEDVYGLADRESGKANEIDTRFNLGSLGKMFTGVAIAQLVEQGQLSFDDPIGMYLSGFSADIADHVTIDQLLTHTSGLGDFMMGGYSDAAKSAATATDLLPLITGEQLLFDPGTSEAYSNSGYVVLGAIIEAVSGQSYYDYVRDHVFTPAGMARTGWFQPANDDATARGYMSIDANGTPVRPPAAGGGSGGPLVTVAGGGSRGGPLITLPPPAQAAPVDEGVTARADNSSVVPWGNPSGGTYSTVGDLLLFAEALLHNELLSPEMTTTIMAGKVPIGTRGAETAYGFVDGTINGVRIVGHGGASPGVSASLDIFPDLGYVVIVLANYDGAAIPVSDRAREILTDSGS